ncbi:MAG: WXG100 family type VII secretion target [Actinobacteria bacterium]|nr:WXG100 family type VII secretion target [Actinomycetota bacterium]
MANTVVGNVDDVNAAIKLTQQKSTEFQSLGKQVQAAMEALRPQYVGPAATSFQNTIQNWNQQLHNGAQAFTEMGNALAQGRNKFQAQDDQLQHQANKIDSQLAGTKSFRGSL